MNRTITHEQILRAFIRAQRLVRKLHREAGTSIDLNQSNLLICVEQKAPARPSDIAEALRMTRSKVSRLVKKMTAAGLLKQIPDPSDSRAFLVELTSSGKKALKIFDKEYNAQTESWSNHLNKKELHALQFFMRELATELGAPAQAKRSIEHPLRTEQRRIARSGGLLAGALFDSPISLLEYHLLQDLLEADGKLALEKVTKLPFDLALISRSTDMLVKAGWIKKTLDSKDRRRATLTLTAKGRTTFLKAEGALTSFFKKLPSLSGRNRKILLSALEEIASLDSRKLAQQINSR